VEVSFMALVKISVAGELLNYSTIEELRVFGGVFSRRTPAPPPKAKVH